jgi:hypothetical protein
MKPTLLVIALLLGTATALPAFAAPAAIAAHGVAVSSVETVQYQEAARSPYDGVLVNRPRNPYDAYASHNGSPSAAGGHDHDVIPGWPCVNRGSDRGASSAFPSWEICN